MLARLGICSLLVCGTLPAAAQEIEVPEESKKEVRDAVMSLVFADQCNKRFDDPKLWADAKSALHLALREAGIADADDMAEKVAHGIEMQPVEKEEYPGFSLFNETMCDKLRTALDEKQGD